MKNTIIILLCLAAAACARRACARADVAWDAIRVTGGATDAELRAADRTYRKQRYSQTNLTVRATDVDRATLLNLARRYPHAAGFEVAGCAWFTEVSTLSAAKGLRRLSVTAAPGARAADALDLSDLAAFPALEELTLDGVTVADLAPLAAATNLTALTLRSSRPRSGDWSALAGLANLRRFRASHTGMRTLEWTRGTRALEVFSLASETVQDFTPLRGLRELSVFEAEMMRAVVNLSFAAGCPRLVRVSVFGSPVNTFHGLDRCPSLRTLVVTRGAFARETLERSGCAVEER